MDKPAVWTMDGRQRPAVALKLELLDAETEEKITDVAEVIFKRYGLNGDGGKGSTNENNYVTSFDIWGSNGKTYDKLLYSSGGMSVYQMELVGSLLKGETIVSPMKTSYKLRLCKV